MTDFDNIASQVTGTAGAPSKMPIEHILVVDDEKSLRMLLTKALTRNGYRCMSARDGQGAWNIISDADQPDIDLVISDISMPGMDGIALLKKVKAHNPDIDFIIMTGYRSQYSYVDIMDAGATDYMTKPFKIDATLARIKRIAREKQNIIALKATNQKLRQAMDEADRLAREAKEASKAKTYFLASMSHEIRTPLNGIVGYTDMLMDTPLDDEQRAFVENARFSCDTLLSVVNDILDFSKVESGKIQLEHIHFDPEVLCFDTIDMIRTQVDESSVELDCRIAESVPARVKGDPHRFRQILLNLLGNAVKFTQKGSIILSLDAWVSDEDCAADSMSAPKTTLKVCVADTGTGIAPEHCNSIFEPFVQSKPASSDARFVARQTGTGLGLAISRNIARKMGGDITVESALNKGTVFYFSARFDRGEPPDGLGAKPSNLRGRHLILVSECSRSSDILAYALEGAGAVVDRITGTALARQLKENKENPPLYDLGIMDLDRSFKPGGSVTTFLSGTTPLDYSFKWMACAIPFPGIARSFQAQGVKGFLSKPVRRKQLVDMAASLLGGSGKPGRDTDVVTVHSLSETLKTNVRILLVEDNPVNQKMTKVMMEKAGYQVSVADNGQAALDAYFPCPHTFDLVLMDINMPVMDGFEATRRLRAYEAEHQLDPVPVLALTANVLENFKAECLAAGMTDFLTKPIKRERIFTAIRKWVK